MSWTLFRATLHQHRTSIFWFTVGLVFYAWVMTWFYPTIGEEYARMIETFPPELLADALDPVNIVAYWQPGLIINAGSRGSSSTAIPWSPRTGGCTERYPSSR